MDSLNPTPSTALQAKAFTSPSSLAYPSAQNDLQHQQSPATQDGSSQSTAADPKQENGTNTGAQAGVSGLVPTLQNIVSTVSLDCRLDLKTIALHARNAEYNPKRFAAVIMRIRDPKTTALIFASGKMVVTGAKSEDDSKLASRKYARIIQKLGFNAKFTDFKIQNIVGSTDIKFPIRLEGLAARHANFSSYEPELFPGLIYRMMKPKIVLLIFVSGKIVLTGAKVREEIYQAFEMMVPVLSDFLSDVDPAILNTERESDEVDVCIVGGGPAGLSSAIKLKQLANEAGHEDFRVILIEKAGEIGDHIVSGNVLEPSALSELLPDWNDESNPNRFEYVTPAKQDKMRFLTQNRAIPIPTPPQMHNRGNYIISLNQLSKWLAERAEEVGVELYPGFAASEILYTPDGGAVKGVATNDLGIARNGKPKDSFERGMEFVARVTLLGEGCHGSLTKQVIQKYDLRRDSEPQTYGLGLKEVWEVPSEVHQPGLIAHSMGYPLSKDVYGGGWLYHFGSNLVSVGLVVGLDYANPWLNPYQEFQKMKQHPFYRSSLEGGKCITYGARALNEGGFQSIPKCAFPGGALIGDSAGFLNVPKIKGTHTAMRSGMLAGEAAWDALKGQEDAGSVFLYDYEDKLRGSSIWKELKQVRNMRPSFHSPFGIYGGLAYSGLEAFVFRGMSPWTLKHKGTDAAATEPADKHKKIEYPKPDGKISFDILTSVSRTGTNHEEDQPVHLQVKDWDAHKNAAFPKYQGIENRFCPAGVYEYVEDESKDHGVRFQINSQNCIHCKTCDIKVPTQDINWQTPQGGEGPKYVMT
ncbi:MAG: hypothetical protein Q9162_007645 [Coniocarpon cinnabarinum]